MSATNNLCTVIYDRCDDGLNWHVMAPEGHLMDSYMDKGEAEMVAAERNLDELRAMENQRYIENNRGLQPEEEAAMIEEMIADDTAASRRRWEWRQSPVTASRQSD